MPKKKVSLSFRELLDSVVPLRAVTELALPMDYAISIAETVQTVEVALTPFLITKEALRNRYSKPRKQVAPGVLMPPEIDPERFPEFKAHYDQLQSQTKEIKIDEIPLSVLKEASEKISPSVLLQLRWLLYNDLSKPPPKAKGKKSKAKDELPE